MNTPLVKGWCPGALRPMRSGDGLVVRVRPVLGRLSPEQATGIADLSAGYGNAMMDLTRRANLQIRGVSDENWPKLLEGLDSLGLLDGDAETEARRNILLSPEAAPESTEWRIAAKLAADLAGLALPAKFGAAIGLHGQPVDMTILPHPGGWALHANGGNRFAIGSESDMNAMAADLARWFLRQERRPAGQRMRGLLETAPLPDWMPHPADSDPHDQPARPLIGQMANGWAVALPFGMITAGQLSALAVADLRLTPDRGLLIEGLTDPPLLQGLILAPDDPLLRSHACTGAPVCPQALGDARALARKLAPQLPAGKVLHVSGCAKGCAHSRPADLTFTATAQGWARIANGRADGVADSILPPNAVHAT